MSDTAVALVMSATGHGTGVLLTPDEILTAAHVVTDGSGNLLSNLRVAAGYNGSAPLGVATVTAVHVNPITETGSGIADSQVPQDYAILHLAQPITGAQTMGLLSTFQGGPATVAGYPDAAGQGVQVEQAATVQVDPRSSLALLDGPVLGSGSSGGPAFVRASDGSRYVVGVDSTANGGTGLFARMTDAAIAKIKGWIAQDDGSAPTLSPPATVVVPETVDALDFDAAYYLRNNPDVAATGVDPERHFLIYGWREGRNPNQLFNTAYYLAHNPDVAAAGVNPLLHFAMGGWTEGRDPSAGFSVTGYQRLNPDVAAAKIDPLKHYLAYGVGEGRSTAASTA